MTFLTFLAIIAILAKHFGGHEGSKW